MNDPVFSVVVPAYNKREMLGNTIASALAQKFADYEIIIVDDGSTDDSAEIVKTFKDPRIRYHYQPNSGLPAAARNKGIKLARGEYIAFLDADDIWYPEKLARCYDIFKKQHDVNLVCHDEVMRDTSGAMIRRLYYGPFGSEMFRKLLFEGNCLSPSAVVVEKRALLKSGLFREFREFYSVEDYDLWLRLSKKYKFYFVPEVLGEYLLHDGNISARIELHNNNLVKAVEMNFKEYPEKRPFDTLLINFRISKIYFVIARYFAAAGRLNRSARYLLKTFAQFFKYA